MRIFQWEYVSKESFKRALAEFQKSDYTLDAEFLDLTSFIFINENIDKIAGVLAFHNHFREAAGKYEFRMIT